MHAVLELTFGTERSGEFSCPASRRNPSQYESFNHERSGITLSEARKKKPTSAPTAGIITADPNWSGYTCSPQQFRTDPRLFQLPRTIALSRRYEKLTWEEIHFFFLFSFSSSIVKDTRRAAAERKRIEERAVSGNKEKKIRPNNIYLKRIKLFMCLFFCYKHFCLIYLILLEYEKKKKNVMWRRMQSLPWGFVINFDCIFYRRWIPRIIWIEWM